MDSNSDSVDRAPDQKVGPLGRASDSRDPFGASSADMRDWGYWLVRAVVSHFEEVDTSPAIASATPEKLEEALGGPLPEVGSHDPLPDLQLLIETALRNMQHGDHPRYFARVPSPSSYAAVLGDWLSTGFNAIASSWAGGSGTAVVESTVLRWIAELVGIPSSTEGVLTSGGSMGILIALSVARNEKGPGVAYLTSQAHASNGRALRILGFPEKDIHQIPHDETFRMSIQELKAAIEADRMRGLTPRIVIASAGTTNTGAIDPLQELAELCQSEDLWLHVDGAYGAPAASLDRFRNLMCGLDRAHSLVLDPHKWLFQPYDIGSVFISTPGALARSFTMSPEYLADATSHRLGEIDYRDRTIELSRRARSLKLWLTFRTYGADAIREAIGHGVRLAEHAEAVLNDDQRWHVVTPAQLAIVTFTRHGASDDDHRRCAEWLSAEGFAAASSTHLNDRWVLRLCTINPRTTDDDITETIQQMAKFFDEQAAVAPRLSTDSRPL